MRRIVSQFVSPQTRGAARRHIADRGVVPQVDADHPAICVGDEQPREGGDNTVRSGGSVRTCKPRKGRGCGNPSYIIAYCVDNLHTFIGPVSEIVGLVAYGLST